VRATGYDQWVAGLLVVRAVVFRAGGALKEFVEEGRLRLSVKGGGEARRASTG